MTPAGLNIGDAVRAHGPASAAGLLTDVQSLVLDAMERSYIHPFSNLAEETGLTAKQVRAVVRSLRAQGLAEYGVCFNEDEPLMNGSGYYLNEEGAVVQAWLRAERRHRAALAQSHGEQQ